MLSQVAHMYSNPTPKMYFKKLLLVHSPFQYSSPVVQSSDETKSNKGSLFYHCSLEE